VSKCSANASAQHPLHELAVLDLHSTRHSYCFALCRFNAG